ncbi:hypothetical protein M422DRAFT_269998 [Sphaerobolus stellatus SS14]|uniref:Ubiquitin-like protease family profile domain-containing protein n=1 Tax=Sphaerobolus stellatus (strain SS14) TaxID=990650 RepID=A0A0C9UID3_SPHS4|nr:hypothetical protein M422DRAFT_269998 [Sphaerobolus stellatus SS14]
MDSLGIKREAVRKKIKEWFEPELQTRYGLVSLPDLISADIPVPTQPNEYDCGLYMIHYIDHFVRNISLIKVALKNKPPDFFSLADTHIWQPEFAARKREDLYVHAQRFWSNIFNTKA